MKKRVISSLVAIGFGSITSAAMALNVTGSVGAGLDHSDNITQSSNDERSDTIRTADVQVAAEHAGDRVQGSLNYNIARDDYAQDTYSAETQSNGTAQLNIELVDDTLNWLTTNSTTYGQADSTENDTPDNSTNQNIFSTGPEWILKLGNVDAITTSAIYQDVSFDNNVEADNSRKTGTIDWTHYLADQRRLMAGVMRSNVDFDQTGQTDYDMDRYYVGYGSESGHLTYDFMLGKDKSKPDIGKDTDGDFRQANVAYSHSDHTLSASYNKELTDTTVGNSLNDVFNGAGSGIGINPTAPPVAGANPGAAPGFNGNTGDINYGLAEVIESTSTALSYSSPTYSGFSVFATIYENKQDYQVSGGDETISGYDLSLNYQAMESLNFVFSYGESTTDFENSLDLGEDELMSTRLGANYSINPQWNVLGWVEHLDQKNDKVAENEFDENRIAIGLRYNFN